MVVEAAVEKKSLTLSRTIARRSPIVFIEKACWSVAASGALWSEPASARDQKEQICRTCVRHFSRRYVACCRRGSSFTTTLFRLTTMLKSLLTFPKFGNRNRASTVSLNGSTVNCNCSPTRKDGRTEVPKEKTAFASWWVPPPSTLV